MPKYQIKLTPVDTFFFGGEKHDSELVANYFVPSNSLPQQTTLLGFLRYYLLFKNNLLLNKNSSSTDKTMAIRLIGLNSFVYNGKRSFGQINKISPLYFVDENSKPYYIQPFDLNFTYKNDILKYKDDKELFNAKVHSNFIKPYLTSEVALKDIYEEDIEQVGNKIAKPGAKNEQGFYRYIKKKLKPGWSFAFDAETKNELNIKDNDFLQFGGEKSIFKVQLSERANFTEALLDKNYKRDAHFISFYSDAFIDFECEEIKNNSNKYKMWDFSVSKYNSFRCLSSNLSTTQNFNDLNNKQTNLIRNKLYMLLSKGSTLYFSKIEHKKAWAEYFKNTDEYKIGFNHFYEINN